MVNIQEIKQLYIKGSRHKLYGLDDNPLRNRLRQFCKQLNPESTFEFGCNVGMNLKDLPNHYGIDINQEAISEGQKRGLNVEIGDEATLHDIKSNSYDMVLTSSVLDHIPKENFKEIFQNLKRITKRYLICLETNDELDDDLFSHDYNMNIVWQMESPKPQGNGANYTCYIWQKDN